MDYEYRVVRKPVPPLLPGEKDEFEPVTNYKGKAGPYAKRGTATAVRKMHEKLDSDTKKRFETDVLLGNVRRLTQDQIYRKFVKGYIYFVQRRPIDDWELDEN